MNSGPVVYYSHGCHSQASFLVVITELVTGLPVGLPHFVAPRFFEIQLWGFGHSVAPKKTRLHFFVIQCNAEKTIPGPVPLGLHLVWLVSVSQPGLCQLVRQSWQLDSLG